MNTPTYIKSTGFATLWSWGNYKYTIDEGDQHDVVVMYDTDYEEALRIFEQRYCSWSIAGDAPDL